MNIQVIINQMVELFLLLGLGYFLYRIHIIDDDFNKKLTNFILMVTTPFMVLNAVLTTTTYKSISTVLFVLLIAVIMYAIFPFVGLLIAKVLRTPHNQMGLYIFMTVFSNIGFVGYPVVRSIFGNGAIFYTSLFCMIFNIAVFTLGMYLINIGSANKASIEWKNLITPGVIASFIALIFYFFHVHFPPVLTSTIGTIGNLTTPLAMIVIGVTLAQIPVKEVFNELRVYPYTLLKQVLFPILAYPVLSYFIADKLILGVSLVMVAMPVGSSAVLFTNQYGGDSGLAAKTIFMTTLFSIITIPFIVALFLA